MAKRLISAAIAIPLGILVLYIDNIYLLTGVMSALSVLATYEIFVATKYLKNIPVTIVSFAFVAFVPFAFIIQPIREQIPYVCLAFLFTLFIIMIFMHEKVKFEQVALVAFISVCIPLAMSSLAFTRIAFSEHGIFYVVFILVAAWIGDAGAYFIGTFFGKHKMAPTISPKKSWEGFFGGVVTSGVFGILLGLGYEWLDYLTTGVHHFTVNIWFLFVISLICAVLGVIGDFSASILKRQCMVKDFGHILPGHGGVLDRFDSVLFVAPFVYLVLKIYEPVSAII